jgi:hypothetical protein
MQTKKNRELKEWRTQRMMTCCEFGSIIWQNMKWMKHRNVSLMRMFGMCSSCCVMSKTNNSCVMRSGIEQNRKYRDENVQFHAFCCCFARLEDPTLGGSCSIIKNCSLLNHIETES